MSSQPYLDSDFQSRWFDFGGDTIVRADKYVRLACGQKEIGRELMLNDFLDTSVLRPIARRSRDGSSPVCL